MINRENIGTLLSLVNIWSTARNRGFLQDTPIGCGLFSIVSLKEKIVLIHFDFTVIWPLFFKYCHLDLAYHFVLKEMKKLWVET